jgi:hypothetical protein
MMMPKFHSRNTMDTEKKMHTRQHSFWRDDAVLSPEDAVAGDRQRLLLIF